MPERLINPEINLDAIELVQISYIMLKSSARPRW